MSAFPRHLDKNEFKLLAAILPFNKTGYKKYYNFISSAFVVSNGRFGGGNLILGSIDAIADLSIPSTPIIANGKVKTNIGEYYLTIHDLENDLLEVDINPFPVENSDLIVENVSSISMWKPGEPSPGNFKVKEYEIESKKYVLAICKDEKAIWLYEYASGLNHSIPVSNFFIELVNIKREKSSPIIKDPSKIFDIIDLYSDYEIILAFLLYCRYKRKFNFDNLLQQHLIDQKRTKRRFNIFRRK